MDLNLTIGLGILALLFILISFNLIKHPLIRVLSLIVGILIMFLIAHHLLLSQDYCQIVISNQTISGNTTSYDYKRECFDYDKSTGSIVFKLMGRFIKIIQYYIMMFVLYLALDYFGIINFIKNKYKSIRG